jgi:hypothetical protein
MAGKSVAVSGEVIATPGTTFFTGADSGTWTAGAVNVQSYSKLTVGSKAVLHEAKCTFTFSGANSGTGATITGSETVTLKAGATLLQKGLTSVLVQGDSATGSFGNKLQVQTVSKLRSA